MVGAAVGVAVPIGVGVETGVGVGVLPPDAATFTLPQLPDPIHSVVVSLSATLARSADF